MWLHDLWFLCRWWELIWILLFKAAPKGVFNIFQLHSAKWTQGMLGKVIMWKMNIINPSHSFGSRPILHCIEEEQNGLWKLRLILQKSITPPRGAPQTLAQDQHCSLPHGPMPVYQLKRLQSSRVQPSENILIISFKPGANRTFLHFKKKYLRFTFYFFDHIYQGCRYFWPWLNVYYVIY